MKCVKCQANEITLRRSGQLTREGPKDTERTLIRLKYSGSDGAVSAGE